MISMVVLVLYYVKLAELPVTVKFVARNIQANVVMILHIETGTQPVIFSHFIIHFVKLLNE